MTINISERAVCEQHEDRFWPHHNPDGTECAGPGFWFRSDHPMYVKPPYLNDAEWELVCALRGDYQQAKRALAVLCQSAPEGKCFCCLGLACHLDNPEGWDRAHGISTSPPNRFAYQDATNYLTSDVQRKLGWTNEAGLLTFNHEFAPGWEDYMAAAHVSPYDLADLNDHGFTFSQIADVIQNGLVASNH